MRITVFLFLLLSLTACVPTTVSESTTRWAYGASDRLERVSFQTGEAVADTLWYETPADSSFVVYFVTPGERFRVAGYRDAGEGGLDWTLVGTGEASGWTTNQLWLTSAPLAARTALPVPSDAVAFMMAGDHNDGFATFLVDGEPVGTFDMYRRGDVTLVVENLPMGRHTLEVRADGRKRDASPTAHVALWGGSALVREAAPRSVGSAANDRQSGKSRRAYETESDLVHGTYTSPAPMRLLLLATLLAVPASAQTVEAPPTIPLPDSTDVAEAEALPVLTTAELLGETEPPPRRLTPYSSLGISGGYAGSVGALGLATGRLGVETPSGLRFGAVAAATTFGTVSTFAVGPEIALRRDLGLGFGLRAAGQGALAVTTSTIPQQGHYASTRMGVGGVLEVERELPLVGSLRLVPRAGVFGSVGRFSAVPAYGLEEQTLGTAGFLLGADLRFRVFGRDASLSMTLPFSRTDRPYGSDALGQPVGGTGISVQF